MQNRKILVVDSKKTNTELLKAQLSEYTVITCNSTGVAMKMFTEEKPDLVILDVVMPGIDGYVFLSAVKKTGFIPVVIITTAQDVNNRIKSYNSGCDCFITKPYFPSEMKAIVTSMINKKQYHDNLFCVQDLMFDLAIDLQGMDNYFYGHSKRVSAYADALGRDVVYTIHERMYLKQAALLHDIGYIGVPSEMFHKQGSLDNEEISAVHTHPVKGESICQKMPAYCHLAPIIRSHHEHFSGSGYPDGLKGQEIPIGARIISIADAFDAMLSPRAYRIPMDTNAAYKIIKDNELKQWDPLLVDKFCKMIDNGDIEPSNKSISA